LSARDRNALPRSMTAPLPNAAVLLGRGDGSENPDLVISQRCDFALFKAGRWRPTFCERPLQHRNKK
jgi:hypothetical protein